MTLKITMLHRVLKYYQVCPNDESGLLRAQGFGLCSSSKRYVCITYACLLEDKQCLFKKLYHRSENDPAKEMHVVSHKKNNNIKDKKERE